MLLSITAINALAAVYSFIADAPDSSLRISVNWLEHSPFKNFLIPGIVLFTIISVRSLKTAIFMLLHWRKAERSLIIQSVLI